MHDYISSLKGDCRGIGCWVGDLLPGCKMCMKGEKTVVFVTGVCPEKCYYCPLSPWRKGKDVFFANDAPVKFPEDVVIESITSGSRGAGITGGDPLSRFERTLKVIKALKEFFGSEYHIHLYTSGVLLNRRKLDELVNAGLDELRIHVTGPHSWVAVKEALKQPITVGIENPSIPGELTKLKELVMKAYDLGVKYVNLNELEFSESNYASLRMRGLTPIPGEVAAEGSMETAIKLIHWVVTEGVDISVHFCPASYKDKYQLRRRLERRAKRTRLPYEEVEGALVRWVRIRCSSRFEKELLIKDAAVRLGEYVLTHPRIPLPEGCEAWIIEAYPTTPRRVLNEAPHPHLFRKP